jgi:N-acetylglucosamine-6-sulfatase
MPGLQIDSRAHRLALIATAAAAFGLASCGHGSGTESVARHPAPQQVPNVVLVLTDDQRVGDVRVMPAVQRLLAAKGVTFAHNFATYPLCCPSRTTFMTGQYAHNHGVLTNSAPRGGYTGFTRKVAPGQTIGVRMQEGGYRTGYVGKFLNGFNPDPPSIVPPGWDVFDGLYGDTEYQMYGYRMSENGHAVTYGTDPRDYQTDVLARKAVGFVRSSAGRKRPFFLTLAPLAPHEDAVPPGTANPLPAPRDLGSFARRPLPRPRSFNTPITGDPSMLREPSLDASAQGELANIYRNRLASLQAVDDAVGRLVATLRRTGQLSNTVIIFTSDNGFLLGEHGQTGKELPYEESTAVPLIVRGPGFPPGVTRTELAGNIDLSPTIRSLGGVSWKDHTDGVPLQRLAADPEAYARRPILFERSHIEGRPYVVARTTRYAYIFYRAHHTPGPVELFDLKRDPGELHNVAGDPAYARAVAALAPLAERLRHCAGDTCRAPAPPIPAPSR